MASPAPKQSVKMKRFLKEHARAQEISQKGLHEGALTLTPFVDSSGNIDYHTWYATIMGPKATPYEGGTFNMKLTVPHDFPMSPPTATFLTKIYHPNINDAGNVCIDILKDKWSPAFTMEKILLSISSMLDDPNPSDPLMVDIAAELMSNPEMFKKHARMATDKYAMGK
jgi:ubiquitin-conjugating enzyme E2 D/E